MSEEKKPHKVYEPPIRTARCWFCQEEREQMQSCHGQWYCCFCGQSQTKQSQTRKP
jgi:hypothetical protein